MIKIPIYGIYAYESMYGGLHGMNNSFFEELENEKAAQEWAIESSYEVMDSYTSFEEDAREAALEDGLEEGTVEFDEYISDYRSERAEYQIYDMTGCPLSLQELKDRCFNEFESLVDDWGREV